MPAWHDCHIMYLPSQLMTTAFHISSRMSEKWFWLFPLSSYDFSIIIHDTANSRPWPNCPRVISPHFLLLPVGFRCSAHRFSTIMLSFPSPSTLRPPESKPSYSLAWSPTQPPSCRPNLLSWTLLVHDPHRSNLYEMQTSAWSLKHKKHNCLPIAHKLCTIWPLFTS